MTAKELIHTGEVDIKLVYRCLFVQGNTFFNDIGDHIRKLTVDAGVASEYNGFWAKLFCQPHGHGGMDPKTSCFIATGSDHSAV